MYPISTNVKKKIRQGKIAVISPVFQDQKNAVPSLTSSLTLSTKLTNNPSCHVIPYSDMTFYIPTSSMSFLFNTLFYQPQDPGVFITNMHLHHQTTVSLSEGANRVLTTPNAGGNSIWSETLSVECLYRLFGANVLYTEMELLYSRRSSPITDYACYFPTFSNNNKIVLGVSVTRAMAYRSLLTKKEATRLLIKKLKGVIVSSQNVMNCRFHRQILHIWVQTGRDASLVKQAYLKLPKYYYSNTVVMITIINCPSLFFGDHFKNN
ncbi:hypothetical protein BJ944DRAFT_235133 [Cunninghamella echinulata]|nr:hypothetical protein BJ944DRAFT_235133 [Cunninghamella echinulata]